MKNLIVLVFVLITKITFAQQQDTVGLNVPFKNGEVAYQKVFYAPNISDALLFSNAQLWFVKHYRNLNAIQIQDDAVGRVLGSGMELLTFKGILGIDGTFDVDMTIQIDCKNGRYRARVFNIVIETEDANKVKIFTNAEQLMNNLLGIRMPVTAANNSNPFNKNQSKRALQSLNNLVDNVMGSINETMNDRDNF